MHDPLWPPSPPACLWASVHPFTEKEKQTPSPQHPASSTFADSQPGARPAVPSHCPHSPVLICVSALSQGASLPAAPPPTQSALCQRPRGPGRGRSGQAHPLGGGVSPARAISVGLFSLSLCCPAFCLENSNDLIKDVRCSQGTALLCRQEGNTGMLSTAWDTLCLCPPSVSCPHAQPCLVLFHTFHPGIYIRKSQIILSLPTLCSPSTTTTIHSMVSSDTSLEAPSASRTDLESALSPTRVWVPFTSCPKTCPDLLQDPPEAATRGHFPESGQPLQNSPRVPS